MNLFAPGLRSVLPRSSTASRLGKTRWRSSWSTSSRRSWCGQRSLKETTWCTSVPRCTAPSDPETGNNSTNYWLRYTTQEVLVLNLFHYSVEKQHPHGKGTDAARGFSTGDYFCSSQSSGLSPSLWKCHFDIASLKSYICFLRLTWCTRRFNFCSARPLTGGIWVFHRNPSISTGREEVVIGVYQSQFCLCCDPF